VNHSDIRRAIPGAVLVLALAAASAWADPQPAAPPMAPPGPPYRVVQERIEVTVNPDFSFTERTEQRIKLLSMRGVQISRMMALGVPLVMPPPGANLMHPAGGIRIESAYTLKANGQRVPAAPTHPPAPPPGLPKMHGILDEATWMSFSQAQVGDELVVAYKGSYKGVPGAPGILLLDEAFPRYMPMDDVQVTLTAPEAMKLHFRTQDIPPATERHSGDVQAWTWKYSSPVSPPPTPGVPPVAQYAAVHMSSFPSDKAEADFFAQRMQAAEKAAGGPDRCFSLGDAHNDGPDGMRQLLMNLDNYYKHGADSFEALIDGLNSPECVFDDGRPKITLLNSVFDSSFDPTPAGWEKSYDYIKTLKKKFPGQPFVAIAEAEYWLDYAFDARGGGYADSVTPEGWKLFRERLEKAERVLVASKSSASRFPTWYEQMTMVQFMLDRPANDQATLFQEGLTRYPGYYPLYFNMVDFASPKWGGSWQAVDNFVAWSVQATKKDEAETLYARLYWYAYQRLLPGEELFRDTLASWPKMKQGFEDLLARHPKSHWDLNNYAHFACMAGDKATYRKLRRRMGKDVVPEAWTGAPTLDVCRAKFGA
jgi:hypothetical protein